VILGRRRAGFFASAATSDDASSSFLWDAGADALDDRQSPVLAGRGERFRARLGVGHKLHVVRDEGRIAAYLWTSAPGMEVPLGLGVSFIVPPNFVYIWDCRTDPAFQGRGVYRRGLRALRRRYARDLRACLIAVERDNVPAILAMRAAGFLQDLLDYRIARLGPLGLYVKGVAPRPFLGAHCDRALLAG
jgi:ribosomal protein S18 acetylase RimI-like enzyme